MYAFGGKWAATNIHMILGKLSATLGAWKDTAITESLRELSNVRRNMAATVIGQAWSALLSAIRHLCRPFGRPVSSRISLQETTSSTKMGRRDNVW